MNQALLSALSLPTEEELQLLSGQELQLQSYGNAGRVDSGKFMVPRQVITIRPHTRFAPFPMHTHNYVELLWQVQGKTEHTMGDGTSLRLQAGELLIFGSQTSHAIARAEKEDIAVNFIVKPEFFDVALEMVGKNNFLGRFLIDVLQQQTSVPYLHFRVAGITPIQLILESLVVSLLEPDFSSRRTDRTAMGLLFLHLLKHTALLSAPGQGKSTHILVLDALREIDQNYREANFAALAKNRGVSAAYLSRIVKEATGQTATALLQQRRLEKARYLLENSDLSVLEICDAVGYHNTSYFYRLFRAHYGCLPSALR